MAALGAAYAATTPHMAIIAMIMAASQRNTARKCSRQQLVDGHLPFLRRRGRENSHAARGTVRDSIMCNKVFDDIYKEHLKDTRLVVFRFCVCGIVIIHHR